MLKFTEAARERVLSFMSQEEEEALALRVSVQPGSPLAPSYELALVDDWQQGAEDTVIDGGGFRVFIDPDSVETLDGATVDWVETMEGGGFKVENPNAKPLGTEHPTGPLAERVSQVIDQKINPAVAAHGGEVKLVDVKDHKVFVKLSGGCQGCGMATVTLRQGIERMIRETIPEVTEIVDVTNHEAGTNPYYSPAK